MTERADFPLRSARAGSLMVALGAVLVIETVVLHLMLSPHHPWIALVLTLGSISALVWLALDYHALGGAHLALDEEWLHLSVGRRASLRLPRSGIVSVTRPGWRDLPDSGSPEARTFVNLTKPAEPNVLVTLEEPVAVALFGAIRKQANRIALHADDAAAVITAYDSIAPAGDLPARPRTGESQR